MQWSSVYYWQVPVDLEQVTAVWFGKTQIPLTLTKKQRPVYAHRALFCMLDVT